MVSSTVADAALPPGLNEAIAGFYDDSCEAWESHWGDHMHHGLYGSGEEPSTLADHRRAMIRMIDEALAFAAVSDDPAKKPKNIVDVGCGAGGSSRYLANKYGAQCRGITLSAVEAERGNALAAAQGLSDKASFQVADALEQPFPDGEFDLVWSMESAEHMPNKQKFVSELARVAAPGATIVIVTWCHRNLEPSENSLKPDELNHLKRICETSHLPNWCSPSDYIKIVNSLSLEDIRTADWSEYVAPFWPAVIKSTLTWKGLISLLSGGWKAIKGAMAVPIMIKGYKASSSTPSSRAASPKQRRRRNSISVTI